MSYSDKLLNIVFDLSSIQAAITAASTEPNKTRCKSCNKKLALTAFNCRCGDYYCSKHRHAEEHNCSYDYKINEGTICPLVISIFRRKYTKNLYFVKYLAQNSCNYPL